MKRIALLSTGLLFVLTTIGAQVKDLALGITKEEWIDAYMPIVDGVGSNARDMLEAQSVKAYMMPVRKASSSQNELSYMAASLLEYYVNIDRNYKVNLSPDYIALNLNNRGTAWTAADAFNFLAKEGTVSAAILPFGSSQLNAGVYATNKYRIDNYLHLFRPSSRNRQKVFEIRKALMRGNPVLVEVKGSEAMKSIQNQRQWQPINNGAKVYTFIVVGYDEKQKAFELMSCWGSKWGDKGYIWVDYDLFSKRAQNAYVLIPSAF
ncbi:MAG: C1 family peptidase [Bacteroidota bacterium]